MTALPLVLMAYSVTGQVVHEWMGVALLLFLRMIAQMASAIVMSRHALNNLFIKVVQLPPVAFAVPIYGIRVMRPSAPCHRVRAGGTLHHKVRLSAAGFNQRYNMTANSPRVILEQFSEIAIREGLW